MVASLAAANVILLVAGTTISTYFAIKASDRVATERDARREAELRERERDRALNQLRGALNEIASLNSALKIDENPASRRAETYMFG